MQTDVAELQNAPQGSATRLADLMVQLFTSEPRERRVTEAGDEATAIMSRLQALETRSTGAMTSVEQRFRGKEATEYQLYVWSGEKSSESFTAFKMELAELGRITARQHDESPGGCRSKSRQTDGAGRQECTNVPRNG